MNAHKITKETVAVKYTINAEGFVGQGTLIIIVEFKVSLLIPGLKVFVLLICPVRDYRLKVG